MQKDITRLLIETKLKNTLKDAEISPERSVRNLIDLGLSITKGRFQQNFLRITQDMLSNEQSAYYGLLKDILINVDKQLLMTFAINIGYNGCTVGAKTIREIEAKHNFNVPWSLTLDISERKLTEKPDFYNSVIAQGTELGINTYLLFLSSNPQSIVPTLQLNKDSAFVLFIDGAQISESFIQQLKSLKNVMVAVQINESYMHACHFLRNEKLLFSAFTHYTDTDSACILNGEWIKTSLQSQPQFAFLLPHPECSASVRADIHRYVVNIRNAQSVPVFLMEVKQDILEIDKIISDDVCMVQFNEEGYLITHETISTDKQFNLFCDSLENILKKALQKNII